LLSSFQTRTERQTKQRTNINVNFCCHHSSRRRQDGRRPSTAPQQWYGETRNNHENRAT